MLRSSSTVETEPGSVASFIIDSDGLVRQIDQTPSFGNSPAYLAIVNDGKEVIAPNVRRSLSASDAILTRFFFFLLRATILIPPL
jgi:hypothetical protein